MSESPMSTPIAAMLEAAHRGDEWFEPLRSFQKKLMAQGMPGAGVAELLRLAAAFAECEVAIPKLEELMLTAINEGVEDDVARERFRTIIAAVDQAKRGASTSIADPRARIRTKISEAKKPAEALAALPVEKKTRLARALREARPPRSAR